MRGAAHPAPAEERCIVFASSKQIQKAQPFGGVPAQDSAGGGGIFVD